jgi:hypothetical protein
MELHPVIRKGPIMSKPILTTLLIILAIASLPAKKFEYTNQAEIDAQGNIYVSSDHGKLIKMAGREHCGEALVAQDKQTVACFVRLNSDEAPQWLQLELYFKGGERKVIEPGAPIREWHFWKRGQQVTVYSGQRDGSGTYGLYDAKSARLIQKLAEPSDERLLPQWAKGRAQIQDESVPMSVALTQERTKWIAKVLRQISKIKPGMRRKDLLSVFTTEGGLSTRLQRTYVHVECPYIKVNVRFTAVNNERNTLQEDPDDLIESISQPYLNWGVSD